MLSVVISFAECHKLAVYDKGRYAVRRYAECRDAQMFPNCWSLSPKSNICDQGLETTFRLLGSTLVGSSLACIKYKTWVEMNYNTSLLNYSVNYGRKKSFLTLGGR